MNGFVTVLVTVQFIDENGKEIPKVPEMDEYFGALDEAMEEVID
jgi:hypothetical protein